MYSSFIKIYNGFIKIYNSFYLPTLLGIFYKLYNSFKCIAVFKNIKYPTLLGMFHKIYNSLIKTKCITLFAFQLYLVCLPKINIFIAIANITMPKA